MAGGDDAGGDGCLWQRVGVARRDPAKASLVVEPYPNQDTPAMQGKTALVGVDVWEHAYYLKYQNRRRDYIEAWFSVIDWEAVATRFAAAHKA